MRGSTVGSQVIDAVRDGDTEGVGAKVVIVDEYGCLMPSGTGILELTDELFLLGIDADQGDGLIGETLAQLRDVGKLCVSLCRRTVGALFVIDAQGKAHLLEQLGHGPGTDNNPQ